MDVQQVVNVLELLEFFAQRGRPATLAEIAKHFGWPRSSTFNLIGTLLARGFLYEPRAREGYYPSPTWLSLVQRIDRAAPVDPALQDLLSSLAARIGETAVLAAMSGMQAVFIAVAESTQSVRYTAAVGKMVPVHAVATGRALLSHLATRDRAAILGRAVYERYTPTTLLDADAVEDEILRSVKRGWFEGNEEYSRDLGGYAVPLLHGDRQLAILVAGPMARVKPRRAEIVRAIRDEIGRLAGPGTGSAHAPMSEAPAPAAPAPAARRRRTG